MTHHREPPEIRPARPDELLAVRRLLDVALLEVEGVERRLGAGDVLVAVDDGTVVGAAVLAPQGDGVHVEAIAVRRRRRDRGVGTALIEAARERYGRLTAEFDPDVRPFYESLGFDVKPAADDGRLRGVLNQGS